MAPILLTSASASVLKTPPITITSDEKDPFSLHSPVPASDLGTPHGSYFSVYRKRRSDGQTINSSEALSIVGPGSGLHSPSSVCSSDRSPCSMENSSYLTPPEGPADYEAPPYKAREDSESLTMLSKRASTLPIKKTFPRSHGNKDSKLSKHSQSTDDQATIPAPVRKTIHEDTVDKKVGESAFLSLLAPPVTTRRWSSVEISPRMDYPAHIPTLKGPVTACSGIHWAQRSADIIRIVHSQLTSRKFGPYHLETPATITLRRASQQPDVPKKLKAQYHRSGSITPHMWKGSDYSSKIASYIITEKDIRAIIELIRQGFEDPYASYATSSSEGQLSMRSGKPSRRKPSILPTGILPDCSSLAETATTISHVQSTSAAHQRESVSQTITLNEHRRASTFTRVLSKNSVHEIIWEMSGSPHKSSLLAPTLSSEVGNIMRKQSNSTSDFVSPATSDSTGTRSSHPSPLSSPVLEQPFACLWRSPKESIAAPNENPRSASGSSTKEESPPTRNAPISSVVARSNILSFAALPSRKTTNDWISPLPDMNTCRDINSRSLYDYGIDATQGSHPFLIDLNQIGPSPVQQTIPVVKAHQARKKSVIQPHPRALNRLSGLSKSGFAVGSSSHARRKSSQRPVEVCIAPSSSEPLESRGWTKPRKDSTYPALISQEEGKEDGLVNTFVPRRSIWSHQVETQKNSRMELLANREPPIPN
jgi:GR25 family glycosyltransferase involved in LPS biosynthesis